MRCNEESIRFPVLHKSPFSYINRFIRASALNLSHVVLKFVSTVKVKVKHFNYRPGQALRVPGS